VIKCPHCSHAEPNGAIFCSECGAQLVGLESINTQSIEPDRVPHAPLAVSGSGANPPGEAWATLHLVETGKVLPLVDQNEYTLGRVNADQPIIPDIDLGPYKAFDHGVSRLHLVIRAAGGRVIVMDLGSANGTYINGTRLAPQVEHAVANGDVIALGKLKLQVVLPRPA